MKEAPLVSVIMPTYNRAEIIVPSIMSVLNQTVQDLELIVVDDQSTDDTLGVIQRLNDPRVVYVRNEGRKGVSGARNFGIARARGSLVGFLDSDDQWRPRKLELQLPVLDSNPDTDVVGCGWRWLNKETAHIRMVRVPRENGRIDGLPRWAYNTCPDLLIRRPLIQATLFDEELSTYECLEWVLRLSMKSRFAYVSDVLIDCYDHHAARASDGQLRCLHALEEVMSRHEGIIRLDPWAWSALNLRLGAGLLMVGGNREKARHHLIRSLRARPIGLRKWAYAAASILPWLEFIVRGNRGRDPSLPRIQRGLNGQKISS